MHTVTSESEFFFSLLRVTTAQIFRASGIDRCAPSVLDTATDITRRFFLLLSETCQQLAEESGRRRVEIADVAQAMQIVGLIHPYVTFDLSDGWESMELDAELKSIRRELRQEKEYLKEDELEEQRENEEYEKKILKVQERYQQEHPQESPEVIAMLVRKKYPKSIYLQQQRQQKQQQQQQQLQANGGEVVPIKKRIPASIRERLLKRNQIAYDFTAFKMEQAKNDPCVSGFIRFVEWAKSESAKRQRLVSRAPIVQAAAGAATLPEGIAGTTAAGNTNFITTGTNSLLDPNKSSTHLDNNNTTNQQGLSLSSTNGEIIDLKKVNESTNGKITPLSPSKSNPTNATTTGAQTLSTGQKDDYELFQQQQQPQNEEWLLSLIKRQTKVGHENRYAKTVLSSFISQNQKEFNNNSIINNDTTTTTLKKHKFEDNDDDNDDNKLRYNKVSKKSIRNNNNNNRRFSFDNDDEMQISFYSKDNEEQEEEDDDDDEKVLNIQVFKEKENHLYDNDNNSNHEDQSSIVIAGGPPTWEAQINSTLKTIQNSSSSSSSS